MTGVPKSQDEFYLGLHTQLIRGVPLELSSSVKENAVRRDIETVRLRTRNEGLAFLTKSLPRLGRALDQALVSGRFNTPRGFKLQRGGRRPLLLGAFFNLVFDEDGFLLDVASVAAIRHLRQLCYFAFKLERPFSEAENQSIIDRFKDTDKNLSLGTDPLAVFILNAAKIITREVFHDFDHKDIHPRHGPGAVATGEKHESKWRFSRLYHAIHQVYPYYEYFVCGGAHELSDRLDWYKGLRRQQAGCARVVLVPKDSRGPRLISCEPLEYQWIQQGLGRGLVNYLEHGSPFTRGVVNFTHQEINRGLAKSSSATQRYSTLDLKDASDRVSLELVRRIFADTPDLLRALEACRTTETLLPNGEVVPLNKFAPMGSALCFPVEAYIFWVTIVSAVVASTHLPWQRVARQVYVYGDDIVIPTEWAYQSIHGLESVDLEVNMDKSCITGFFRESCGLDAYRGEEVTPTRIRKQWTSRPTDGSALAAYCSTANSLANKGYKHASDFLWLEIERTYGKIPFGTYRSSYPCRVTKSALVATSLNVKLFRHRLNRNLQRSEFLVPSLIVRRRPSRLDGWLRLLRNLVSPPVGDPSVVVLARSTKIKRSWMSVT